MRGCGIASAHVDYRPLCPPPWLHERQEWEADEWAADALISQSAYESAERLVGSHAGALAHELGVTTHLIRVWRGLCERTCTRWQAST